jgi:hypothetical protein
VDVLPRRAQPAGGPRQRHPGAPGGGELGLEGGDLGFELLDAGLVFVLPGRGGEVALELGRLLELGDALRQAREGQQEAAVIGVTHGEEPSPVSHQNSPPSV